jgi:hypothetical protein
MFERAKQSRDVTADVGTPSEAGPGRSTLSQQLDAPAQHEVRTDASEIVVPERKAPAMGGGRSLAQLFPGARKALDPAGTGGGFGPPDKNGTDGTPSVGGTPFVGTGAEPMAGGPKKKKAGVESFTVDWAKGAIIDPTAAKLRLDYNAKFKKDDDHDPALAEFRQNAGDKWEITDGPHKGQKGASPLADDNYSRADDLAGNKKTDQLFYSNDNPGWGIGKLDKDDVLDYEFTAEQMIIDTSDGNKVIAKRGPHTGTIKGKSPRVHGNVPKKLA